jgi:hypothetical protein
LRGTCADRAGKPTITGTKSEGQPQRAVPAESTAREPGTARGLLIVAAASLVLMIGLGASSASAS